MGGQDKLAVELAGRPVLAWSLAAHRGLAGRRADRRSSDRRRRLPSRGPRGCRPVVAVVPGGARRQESVAAGIRALEAASAASAAGPRARGSCSSTTAHGRSSPPRSSRRSRGCRRPWRRDPGPAGGRPQARRRRPSSSRRSIAPACCRPRRPRAPAGTCSATPLPASRPDGRRRARPTRRSCWPRAWRSRRPRRGGEPQDHAARRPRARRVAPGRAPATTRTGFGTDSHPFGPGDGLRLGGIEIEGAPAPPRPLRRRRRAPRALRRAARRRPASATSGGSSRPSDARRAASTARSSSRACVERARRGGLAPARGRPHDPRRAAAARRDRLDAHARRDRGAVGLAPTRSASRPRRATCRATRAPAGSSAPSARTSSAWRQAP